MEIVTIYRIGTDDQGTQCVVIGPRGWACLAMELPWRDNRSNRSCISAGEYLCKIHRSRKFGIVFHITGVDGRTWILIHAGNLAGDVERGWKTHSYGCILLAKRFGSLDVGGKFQAAGLVSKPTVRQFVEHMGSKPFRLRIVEIARVSGKYKEAA